jgi:chloramphenicol-sensitive protein RarD
LRTDSKGLALTLGAFLIWGLSPVFWKVLVAVPASQLLAHRIVWAALMLLVLMFVQNRWGEVRRVLGSRRVVLTLLATTFFIGSNWLLYIWAIVTDRILQASLGYYINPLVTVVLAMVFVKERLNRAQWWCIALASAGVTVLVWRQGEVPWIALVLAVTFGLYGLLRKQVGAEAEVGLFVETSVLLPFVLGYLIWLETMGLGAMGHSGVAIDALLVASGLITAVPLLLFTQGARRIPLSTVGFLQFFAPTLQFVLAVFLYREPFTATHLAAFSLIWASLALFSWDLRRQWRRRRLPAA